MVFASRARDFRAGNVIPSSRPQNLKSFVFVDVPLQYDDTEEARDTTFAASSAPLSPHENTTGPADDTVSNGPSIRVASPSSPVLAGTSVDTHFSPTMNQGDLIRQAVQQKESADAKRKALFVSQELCSPSSAKPVKWNKQEEPSPSISQVLQKQWEQLKTSTSGASDGTSSPSRSWTVKPNLSGIFSSPILKRLPSISRQNEPVDLNGNDPDPAAVTRRSEGASDNCASEQVGASSDPDNIKDQGGMKQDTIGETDSPEGLTRLSLHFDDGISPLGNDDDDDNDQDDLLAMALQLNAERNHKREKIISK